MSYFNPHQDDLNAARKQLTQLLEKTFGEDAGAVLDAIENLIDACISTDRWRREG